MTVVVGFVPNLMDRSKVSAAAGDAASFVSSPASLPGAAARADVVVLDLSQPGVLEVLPAVVATGVRTVGFGSHVDRDLLSAARSAGCGKVVARSAFFGGLPDVLEVDMIDTVAHHRRACDAFTRAVAAVATVGAVGGQWDAPSPCAEWDARGVVEHVIGFHDALLLKPLGVKPHRPKDDVAARWAVTVDALFAALAVPGAVDNQRESLLGVLTTDVLIHTWDLSRAVGLDATLDEDLCEIGYERALQNQEKFQASDMFGAPVAVRDDASLQDKLIGLFGRDPNWTPEQRITK